MVVEPILQNHCQKCHVEGGLAPFALMTYDEAKQMSPALVVETGARRMPPWGAQDSDECKPRLPWNHDERLTQTEIDTLAKWDAAGSPEGDPKDAPPPAAPPTTDLKDATLTLSPKTPFTASGDRDEFRCFVLDDPALAAGAYVTGINVVPGNRKVVHHSVVFTDPDGTFAARAGADGSFDCSGAANAMAGGGGGMQMGGANSITLAVWTPGGEPVDLPPNIAMPIAANSKVIMQIHYSPGGQTNSAPDVTKVQLRIGTTKPEYLLFTTAIGNYAAQQANGDGLQPGDNDPGGVPTFLIPKNVSNHIESMRATIPDLGSLGTVWIYGVLAHEHLAGIDVKIDLDRGADSQCLLQDKWDFHWQRMYTYAAPVEKLPTVAAGDVLRIRCTYDNTMSNRRLGTEYAARGLSPMDLHLGEQTIDEMCLAIPQLLIKSP
jgi:hypothetical protein